jgi:hypothetical protein
VRVSRYRLSVLFDSLLDNAVWNGEHLVNEVSEAVEFGVATLRILGRRSRVARQNSLLESESRRSVRGKSIQPYSSGVASAVVVLRITEAGTSHGCIRIRLR